jgi:hypothetical protein
MEANPPADESGGPAPAVIIVLRKLIITLAGTECNSIN